MKKRYKVFRPSVKCVVCGRWFKGIKVPGRALRYLPWPHKVSASGARLPCLGCNIMTKSVVQM